MQTTDQNKTYKNYWHQDNTKNRQSQYSFSKSPYFTTRIDIDFYEHSFNAESEIEVSVPGHIPLRKKDDIEFFSKHSRTRLIKFFTQIKLSEYHKINFVTLTFHDDYPKDNFALKKFLDNFQKKLNYHFPDLDWMWRFEMQERGAPHFHFILLSKKNMKGFSNEKLKRNTRKLFFDLKECTCSHCLKYGFDFVPLETPQKCFAYISKYVAKINENNYAQYNGRRWGNKRNIPCNPIETLSLRGYQFVYFKKLLRDFYRGNTGKVDYIDSNINSLSSWFLICDTFDIRNIILTVLTTSIQIIFYDLKKEGYICEKEILDIENCICSFHLNPDIRLLNIEKSDDC
jgi:hypothetical protein